MSVILLWLFKYYETMSLSISQLSHEINCKRNTVKILQDKGVIQSERFCERACNDSVFIWKKNYCWCSNKMKFRNSIGIHKSMWWENSRLLFDTVVFFVHSWIKNYTTTQFCSNELNMCTIAITDWKTSVCADFLKNPVNNGTNKVKKINELYVWKYKKQYW